MKKNLRAAINLRVIDMKALLLIPLLAGCTPALVHSNAQGGVISLAGVVQEQRKGMALAEAECAKHGKLAIAKGQNVLTDTLRYECS